MSTRLRLLAALLCLGACTTTSTTFTSTWKAPDAQAVSPVGKTVAAVFVSPNESRRRSAEDTLAADITARGARGIAAYTVLPDERSYSGDKALAALKQAGANGAVIMRVVGRDQRITYTPGYAAPGPYRGFGPYWGYGWGTVYEPGYLQSDTLVSVETLVYSLANDKLLWASTSRTTNPQDLDRLVNEVADVTAKEMVKQGVLAP
ncbi:MAG TPA: hypothetical protein VGP32_01455 [Steroidobacteraceae bacterium]|jgi:hypothetical protein|nr:hypothetical protein [Steroidobacteraceae bacterium]